MPSRALPLLLTLASLLCFQTGAAGPVLRLARSAATGTNLLANPSFEDCAEGTPVSWREAPAGGKSVAGQGRGGSQALYCRNTDPSQWTGASQTIVLRQTAAAPLVVSGWSKAEEVSGSMDNNYSIYVDLTYTDGTQLWGQTAQFRTGTHDWERREVVILPEKPIQSLTVHCLLRHHVGAAWFDDIGVAPVQGGDAATFDGVPVVAGSAVSPSRHGPVLTHSTTDGLRILLAGDRVRELQVGDHRLDLATAFSGFVARDVAAGSDVYLFDQGKCEPLQLGLRTEWKSRPDCLVVDGVVRDLKGSDRAVSVSFQLPIDAIGWKWGDDIRRSRTISGKTDFNNPAQVPCGANGTLALYPLAALYNATVGLAIGIDMDRPAQYRLGYNAGTRQLYVAYDFGLVRETKPESGAASFRFVIFHFDPKEGFRTAFDKYTRIFPAHFHVRSKEQGIWMPFTDVSTVEGWEDFGFKYHEGNNNVPWDDQHGILSFRYTEPMTWWMRMEKGVARTASEALRVRSEILRGDNQQQAALARASEIAAMWDDAGQPALKFRNEPWCDGAIWSLNPNPHLPAPGQAFNAATIHWNEKVKERLYGAPRKGDLDGEYLDSLEGYVTADLNFRREHFQHTTVPLTFDKATQQPALFKGLAVYEFTRWLSEDVHKMGKLMFANGVPYRFTFLCPWLDVLGTETDWLRQGKYSPASDRQMSLWRTMSGQKPYVILMNTDYDAFTPDLVERYFQRSLFYGMFPSMFSHNASENPYWRNPKWYNRDRALFKKYIPVIKRVAEAGWQPVTHARLTNPELYLERFGPDANGNLYFTILNDSRAEQKAELKIDADALDSHIIGELQEMLTGAALKPPFTLVLQPDQVRVIQVNPGR